jgi:uncharacterized protein (DUF1800 family)
MQEVDTPTRRLNMPSAIVQSGYSSNEFSASNPPLASNSYTPHALTLLASALLAACGGSEGNSSASGGGLPSAPGFNNFPQAKTDEEAARFLQQSQFASTAADIAKVSSTNFANYLQEQFSKPIQQTGWEWLESRGYGADSTAHKYVYADIIGDFMVWSQLMGQPDAMRKRVALALSEFMVVSVNAMEVDWRGYVITAYWDLLNQYAFGNFRDLLEAVTLSPAMGYYLNTHGNIKENASGRLPDENYAREVMQLFTIGLYELNLNGSIKTDGSGKKLETYDSDDVSQLARVFTGYNAGEGYGGKVPIVENGVLARNAYSREYARQPMKLTDSKHSDLAVSFLNTSIPANTPGANALKMALDTLFNHPNVGPFFGRQMIQRLVTSNPSPAYVARVASAFNNNGAGVRGDMKAVWTAVLLDDEARGATALKTPDFGKVREPMLRLVQWAKTFNATSKAGSWKIRSTSRGNGLGQSPLRSPSVFNFFRPGYVPPGASFASSNNQMTVPEFQILNETTVGSYLNFMQTVIREGVQTPSPKLLDGVDSDFVRTDVQGNYDDLLALINNSSITDAEAQRVSQALVERLNLWLTAGQLSSASMTEITTALKSAMLQNGKRITNANTAQMSILRQDLVAAAILMIMASPDYLIQK